MSLLAGCEKLTLLQHSKFSENMVHSSLEVVVCSFYGKILKLYEKVHRFFFIRITLIRPQPQILEKNTKNDPKIFLSDSYYHFFHIQSQ